MAAWRRPCTISWLPSRPQTLQPGDSLITTDPWIGASQINDVFFVTPIFHRGRIVAYAMSVSHSPDVGGRLLSADSKEVFEEGFRLPIIKLFKAGEPNEDLVPHHPPQCAGTRTSSSAI